MAWTNILQIFFPIGSVYFSTVNSSSASTIGGTWTQITNRFIRTGTSPTTTGGSDTHTHTYGIDFLGYHSSMANYNQHGNETFIGLWNDSTDRFEPGDIHHLNSMNGLINNAIAVGSKAISNISHTGTTQTLIASNAPAYYTVCMWVRIA